MPFNCTNGLSTLPFLFVKTIFYYIASCSIFFLPQSANAQQQPRQSYFEASKNLEIFNNTIKELHTFYVDPIAPGELVKTGIDAMLQGLDPYTNYITESDIEDYEFMTTGRYGGIGASIRYKSGNVFVGDVYEGSPAQMAGLHPGDLILSIDNETTKDKSDEQISLLLKGSPGSQVNLKIKDAYKGEETNKLITRGEIELSSVPYAALLGPEKNIAYVRLTQFTPACARIVRAALDSLKTAQPKLMGVMLDLRSNPGGLLDEAINLCNVFIDRGQLVVSTKGKMADWDKEYKTSGPAWDTKIPVTVLINHSSASASEIVSGTLQDLDRGVIIGERSYGKGLVQTTRPLGYNARIKLTTAKYYTPSGRCIQALDYTHRNADGSVGKIPDSLKKSYRTTNGRTVLSGGGVAPDLKMEDTAVSRFAATVYSKNFLFDYATQYAKNHKEIAPAESFKITPAEWDEFSKWISTKDFAYKTATEIMLDSLMSVAGEEKLYAGAKTEFSALKNKVSHDKKVDLQLHKAEVKMMLENEIVGRYYYQKGRIAHKLHADPTAAKAVDLLLNPARYNALLKGK